MKIISVYNLLSVCPFDFMDVVVIGKVGPVNRLATTTDRPKLVQNRLAIKFW